MAESIYGYTRGQSCLWMAPPPENWGKPLTGLGSLGGNWRWQVATQPVNTLESQSQSHILVPWNDMSEERVAQLLEKGDWGQVMSIKPWRRFGYIWTLFIQNIISVRKIFLCKCQNGRHTWICELGSCEHISWTPKLLALNLVDWNIRKWNSEVICESLKLYVNL